MSGWAKQTLIEALEDCALGLPFSSPVENQKAVYHIIEELVTFSSPDALMPFKWQRTIINWRWDRCVSTHMARHTHSSLSVTQGERKVLFWGWTSIRHMTRDTCMRSPRGCAASHTRREWQVSRTIPPATSLFHFSPPPQGPRVPEASCKPENLGRQAREFWNVAAS